MGARKPYFSEQVHEEPIRSVNDNGSVSQSVEVHTYAAGEGLAMIEVRGDDMDHHEHSIDLWVSPGEVLALRDACNQMLGEA